MSAAQDLLRDPDVPAVALLRAAKSLVGDFTEWEPESLWLSLEHHGVDAPLPVRARLMAVTALHLSSAFYWDALVFEKTAVALAGRQVLPDILEEPTPAELAWAVEEAAWIRRLLDDEPLVPEHEPTAYSAVILDRAGMVLAPEQLSFCQEVLDGRLPKSELKERVRKRWPGVRDKLPDVDLRETDEDVQLARLSVVELHVMLMTARAKRALGFLA